MAVLLTYLGMTTYVFIMKTLKYGLCYPLHLSPKWFVGKAVRIYLFPVILITDIVHLKRTLMKMKNHGIHEIHGKIRVKEEKKYKLIQKNLSKKIFLGKIL